MAKLDQLTEIIKYHLLSRYVMPVPARLSCQYLYTRLPFCLHLRLYFPELQNSGRTRSLVQVSADIKRFK